jgi:hypothetical protein
MSIITLLSLECPFVISSEYRKNRKRERVDREYNGEGE